MARHLGSHDKQKRKHKAVVIGGASVGLTTLGVGGLLVKKKMSNRPQVVSAADPTAAGSRPLPALVGRPNVVSSSRSAEQAILNQLPKQAKAGAIVHSPGGSITQKSMNSLQMLWKGANQNSVSKQLEKDAGAIVKRIVPDQPGRINTVAGKAGRVAGRAARMSRKLFGR